MHFVSKERHLLCGVLDKYHPDMTEILLSGMSTFILSYNLLTSQSSVIEASIVQL